MRFFIVIIAGMVLGTAQCYAQNVSDEFTKDSFEEFRRSIYEDFENFRKRCMAEFIEFVKNPWAEFEETAPVPKPKEDNVPPRQAPNDDVPVDDNPVVIDEVVTPKPVEPQPEPVEPIVEVPIDIEKTVSFTFFGTCAEVRYDIDSGYKLNGIDGNSIADGLEQLFVDSNDNTIADCLNLRSKLHLSDWAYVSMLKKFADKACGENSNEAVLLMAYIYMQSGYQMRLATDGKRLYMLYSSKHQIFEQNSYVVDGVLYYGVEKLPAKLNICQAAFAHEKSLSLLIAERQLFDKDYSEPRKIRSKGQSGVEVTSKVNKNLIDFYNHYPSSMVDNNIMSRWAMFANTPVDENVECEVYSQLRAALTGDKVKDMATLLDFVQTGFEYEYDDVVWGGDRVFFAEETLYYPFCDCEDRSILLSRLVRDLLGLDVLLVFYPGHLATAVALGDDVKGDYIMHNGKKYVVCDPTYIGAPIGLTMPEMDNKSATVILLD